MMKAPIEIANKLDEYQLKACEAPLGNTSVFAVAGSGKTTLLTYRVANFIHHGIPENEILLVTFTNQAAEEMKTRICKVLNREDIKITSGTFHSIAALILNQVDTRKHQIIDDDDAFLLFKDIYNDHTKEKNDFNKKFKEDCKYKQVFSVMSFAINHFCSYEEAYKHHFGGINVQKLDKMKEIIQDYKKMKRRMKVRDFDDLILDIYVLFKNNESVRDFYANKFKYIFVDEYQDVNYLQYHFLKFLNKHNNMFVIGDRAQCIVEGELVLTDSGYKKVEEVTEIDLLASGIGRGKIDFFPTNKILKTKCNDKIIKVTTNLGYSLKTTLNHIFLAQTPIPNKYVVYLMYKSGYGFRIGRSKDNKSTSRVRNGYEKRMWDEQADKIWILNTYDSLNEAAWWELYYSSKYGIPTYCFIKNSSSFLLSQNDIKQLFNATDSLEKGFILLNNLSLDFDAPHYDNSKATNIQLGYFVSNNSRNSKNTSEICFNTVDKDLNNQLEYHLDIKSSIKINQSKVKYYNGRKNSCDATKLESLLNDLKQSNLPQKYPLAFSEKFKFINNEQGFKPILAKNLRKGMIIPVFSGSEVVIDCIENIEIIDFDGYVYDFSIPQTRNFISNGIITHNCIYQFRGSKDEYMESFEVDYPDVKTYFLKNNYRSRPEILNVAEVSINKNNFKHPVELIPYKESTVNDGAFLTAYDTNIEEVEDIVNIISESFTPDNYEQVVILVRNNMMSKIFEQQLSTRGVPCRIVGSISFYKRTQVKLCINLLQFLENTSNVISFNQIATLFDKLGKVSAMSLHNILISAYNGDISKMYSEFKFKKETHKELFKLLNTVNKADKTYLKITTFVDKFLGKYLKDKFESDYKDRIADTDLLASQAMIFDKVEDFLSVVTLNDKDLSEEDDTPKVTIMTMHKSKGKEWDYVFLPNITEGILPSRVSALDILKNEKNVQNERNLFYVACTRAREKLFISYHTASVPPNMSIGFARPTKMSVFLEEVSEVFDNE